MKRPAVLPPILWAAGDILRRPGRTLLLATCLASLVFLIATPLLFSQALDATRDRLFSHAPDLVIRRVDGSGWRPMPTEALAVVSGVPGVVEATARLWGVVAGPDEPLTAVASPAVIPSPFADGMQPPAPGQAVVSRRVAARLDSGRITLGDRPSLTLTVTGTFPETTGLATDDLVWMNADDARRLLGLSGHQASDIAVRLARREEETAIQPDLAAAFPWPVHITDRSTADRRDHTRTMRWTGIRLAVGLPALLAFLLVVVGIAAGNTARRPQWGLLRALGWTTGDIIRLQVAGALITGVPAVAVGLAAAYAMVFFAPLAGLTSAWITGGHRMPTLILSRSGALLVMLEIAAVVGIPYLAAVFLTSLRGVADDPWAMLQADSWN